MPGYDRPCFESPRERSFRERDLPSSRRGSDDEDDRGPWISRDRGEFERFERGRRFDPFDRFEDWQAYRGTIPSRDHR